MRVENNHEAPSLTKGGRTRLAIVQSAVLIIADKGIRGLSISDVVERLSIKRSSFYTHFSNIDDLIDAVSRHVLDRIGALSTRTSPKDRSIVLSRIRMVLRLRHTDKNLALALTELYSNHPPTVKDVHRRLAADLKSDHAKRTANVSPSAEQYAITMVASGAIQYLKQSDLDSLPSDRDVIALIDAFLFQ
ncbi:MAG: TetR/AcrR family transcriptional regulator [Pseudomonadota bacterium]